MERTFEELLVGQCAPTLKGIKPASLFRYQATDKMQSVRAAAHWAKELVPFGLTVRVLKICPKTGACLIYLYREERLRRILAEPSTQDFLREEGYDPEQPCELLLNKLSRRLCLQEEFPHEIGVFLGYPLEDVVGFIRHHGRDFTCCGYWKVYGDPVAAQRRFACYRHCTACCQEQLRRGVAITRMIAA